MSKNRQRKLSILLIFKPMTNVPFVGGCKAHKTNRLSSKRVISKRMPLRTTVTIVSEAISSEGQYAKITFTHTLAVNPIDFTRKNVAE